MEYLKSEKDLKASAYLGTSFLKMPWRILRQMVSEDPSERLMGQLHVTLFGICYHTPGWVSLGSNQVFCDQGEYVGSYRHLAGVSGLKVGSIPRLLGLLEEKALIEVNVLKGGSRIRICGYKDFMALTALAPAVARKAPKGMSLKTPAQRMADREASLGRSMAVEETIHLQNMAGNGK